MSYPGVLDEQGVDGFRKAMYLYLDLKVRLIEAHPVPVDGISLLHLTPCPYFKPHQTQQNRFTGPDPYPNSDPRDFQTVRHYLALTIQDEMLCGPSMGLAYLGKIRMGFVSIHMHTSVNRFGVCVRRSVLLLTHVMASRSVRL